MHKLCLIILALVAMLVGGCTNYVSPIERNETLVDVPQKPTTRQVFESRERVNAARAALENRKERGCASLRDYDQVNNLIERHNNTSYRHQEDNRKVDAASDSINYLVEDPRKKK